MDELLYSFVLVYSKTTSGRHNLGQWAPRQEKFVAGRILYYLVLVLYHVHNVSELKIIKHFKGLYLRYKTKKMCINNIKHMITNNFTFLSFLSLGFKY